LSDTTNKVKDKAKDIADNVKSKVKKAARNVKSKGEDLRDDIEDI